MFFTRFFKKEHSLIGNITLSGEIYLAILIKNYINCLYNLSREISEAHFFYVKLSLSYHKIYFTICIKIYVNKVVILFLEIYTLVII